MNRIHLFIFFFFIICEFFLIHIFAYYWIVKRFKVSVKHRFLLIIFFSISASIVFITRYLCDTPLFFPFAIYAFLWLGIISIAVLVSFLEYLVLLILRDDLRKLAIIFAVFFLIVTISLYICRLPSLITRIDIPIEYLPQRLTGFSIVQLSDLHLEGRKSKEWLRGIINTTNELNPGLIVITGDLISRGIHDLGKFSALLKQLKSKNGIYVVTGNHDHYAGTSNFLDFCRRSDIKVLRNEHILINNEIELIGIDDQRREMNKGSESNLEEAIRGCDLTKPSVLLSHKPNYFKKAVDLGVDLQLSGHTHAGQIPPMDLIYFLIYRYPYGLYRYKSSFIYTTSGTGTWGPPMRLSSRSEIVLIKLIAKGK